MLDTTSWKIKVSSEQVNKILSRSKEFSEFDHETKTTRFRIIKDNIDIGSYDSNITIKCYEDNHVFIEFSVPKQYLGNNVELLYPSQLDLALGGVYHCLVDRFGAFPPYMTWQLYRLDLCYSWRLASQAEAAQALGILQTLDYPRKNKYLYKESVMWKGKTFSVKFYLKHNEYIKHSKKELKKENINPLVDKAYKLSEGVLRFEITYRKQGIDNLFNKKLVTYRDLLNKDFIETTLNLSDRYPI